MSAIVITGGGLSGMITGILLARDGHEVTVLERDPAAPPAEPAEMWANWDRRGVAQFHLGHLFLPRFRHEVERELPDFVEALLAIGALEQNLVRDVPDEVSGGWDPDDARYTSLTGRRPIVEAVLAHLAADQDGLRVERGRAVDGLLTDDDGSIVGVATDDGARLAADLVVDATGRRTPIAKLLVEAGLTPPREHREDSGFVYFGRTYSSLDGSVPPFLGGALQEYDSVSTLTLPADNGTWFCGLVACSGDKELRKVRDPAVFERVWRSYPLVAHWVDGIPDAEEVKVMAGIEDRITDHVIDGTPISPGLIPIGDSWASTNPSVGRGASIATLHAIALRDLLRVEPLDDPQAFALVWQATTEKTVRPWYDDTLCSDRNRLAHMKAQIAGADYTPTDPVAAAFALMPGIIGEDPDLFRAYLDIVFLYRTKKEVLVDGGLLDEVLERGQANAPAPGPTRRELEELLAAS